MAEKLTLAFPKTATPSPVGKCNNIEKISSLRGEGFRHRLNRVFRRGLVHLLPVALLIGTLASISVGTPQRVIIVGASSELDDGIIKVHIALVLLAALLLVLSNTDLKLGVLVELSNPVADQVVGTVGFRLDVHEGCVSLVPSGLADTKLLGSIVGSEGNVGVTHHGVPFPSSYLVRTVHDRRDDTKHPIATTDGLIPLDALDARGSASGNLLIFL